MVNWLHIKMDASCALMCLRKLNLFRNRPGLTIVTVVLHSQWTQVGPLGWRLKLQHKLQYIGLILFWGPHGGYRPIKMFIQTHQTSSFGGFPHMFWRISTGAEISIEDALKTVFWAGEWFWVWMRWVWIRKKWWFRENICFHISGVIRTLHISVRYKPQAKILAKWAYIDRYM